MKDVVIDLAAMVADCIDLLDGDIVVVTSKIVSKAEGCAVELDTVEPSPFARQWASQWDKDPRLVEIVLRQSRRVVRQNLAWSLGYNVLALPLAAAGLVTPWMAALAMALSSLTVTLNALRLARVAD